jgi:hypothetical protein
MKKFVYKLHVFLEKPNDFEGLLFSFSPIEGAQLVKIDEDPYQSIKQAVVSALGQKAGLIIEGLCFFSELFMSLYEQLGLIWLETQDYFVKHTQVFLEKKQLDLSLISFKDPQSTPVILIGKSHSLHQDIEKIKKVHDRAFIVACYSVLSDLASYGLDADLVFASDPGQINHGFTNAKVLYMSAKADQSICLGFQTVALFPESFCQYSNYLFSKTPHAPTYGYTIMDHTLKFLLQTGFQTFYLSGIDLEEVDGRYADGNPCGFKPDFKKAKEHLDLLKSQNDGVLYLRDVDINLIEFKKPEIIVSPFPSKDLIEKFESGFRELKSVDFQTLGLYEMFCLEQNPFYQVVLEPLYDKSVLFAQNQQIDKRLFFQGVMQKYADV